MNIKKHTIFQGRWYLNIKNHKIGIFENKNHNIFLGGWNLNIKKHKIGIFEYKKSYDFIIWLILEYQKV